jgi:hypothetical protein
LPSSRVPVRSEALTGTVFGGRASAQLATRSMVPRSGVLRDKLKVAFGALALQGRSTPVCRSLRALDGISWDLPGRIGEEWHGWRDSNPRPAVWRTIGLVPPSPFTNRSVSFRIVLGLCPVLSRPVPTGFANLGSKMAANQPVNSGLHPSFQPPVRDRPIDYSVVPSLIDGGLGGRLDTDHSAAQTE